MIEEDFKFFKNHFTANSNQYLPHKLIPTNIRNQNRPASNQKSDSVESFNFRQKKYGNKKSQIRKEEIYNQQKNDDYNLYTFNSNFQKNIFENKQKSQNLISNSSRMDVLNELKSEHDNLKKMNYNQNKILSESQSCSIQQSKEPSVRQPLKKKSYINQENLIAQKKKLQNELTNKMKKIEQLLLNQRQYQKTIHNMKVQLDGKHSEKQCAKTIRKLKQNQNDIRQKYQKEINNYKSQILTSKTTISQLRQQIQDRQNQFQSLKNNYNDLTADQKRKKQQYQSKLNSMIEDIRQKQSEFKRIIKQKDDQFYYRESDLKKIIKQLEQNISQKQYEMRRNNYNKNLEFKQNQRKIYEQFYKQKSLELSKLEQQLTNQKKEQIKKITQEFQIKKNQLENRFTSDSTYQLKKLRNQIELCNNNLLTEKKNNQNLLNQISGLQNTIKSYKYQNEQLLNKINENKIYHQKQKELSQSKAKSKLEEQTNKKEEEWTKRLVELIDKQKQNNFSHFQKIISEILQLNKLKEKQVEELRLQKVQIEKKIIEIQLESKRTINQLNFDIQTYKSQVLSQNQNLNLANSQHNNQQLKIQILKLKEEIMLLRESSNSSNVVLDYRNKIQSVSNELSILKKFLDEQNKAKKLFLQQMELSKQKMKKLIEENESLNTEIQKIHSKYNLQIDKQIKKRDNQLLLKNQLIQNMKNGYTEINQRLTHSETQLHITKLNLNQLNNLIKQKDQQIFQNSATISQLNNQYNQLAHKFESYKIQLQQNNLQNQNNKYIQEIQILKNQFQIQRQRIIQGKNEEMKRIIQNSERQRNNYLNEINLLKRHIQDLEAALRPIQPKFPIFNSKNKQNQIQIAYTNLQLQYNRLNSELNQQKKNYSLMCEKYQTKIKSIQNEQIMKNSHVQNVKSKRQSQLQLKNIQIQKENIQLKGLINILNQKSVQNSEHENYLQTLKNEWQQKEVQYNNNINKLSQQIEKSKRQTKQAINLWEQLQKEYESLSGQYQNHRNEYKNLEKQCNQYYEKVNFYIMQNNKLKQQGYLQQSTQKQIQIQENRKLFNQQLENVKAQNKKLILQYQQKIKAKQIEFLKFIEINNSKYQEINRSLIKLTQQNEQLKDKQKNKKSPGKLQPHQSSYYEYLIYNLNQKLKRYEQFEKEQIKYQNEIRKLREELNKVNYNISSQKKQQVLIKPTQSRNNIVVVAGKNYEQYSQMLQIQNTNLKKQQKQNIQLINFWKIQLEENKQQYEMELKKMREILDRKEKQWIRVQKQYKQKLNNYNSNQLQKSRQTGYQNQLLSREIINLKNIHSQQIEKIKLMWKNELLQQTNQKQNLLKQISNLKNSHKQQIEKLGLIHKNQLLRLSTDHKESLNNLKSIHIQQYQNMSKTHKNSLVSQSKNKQSIQKEADNLRIIHQQQIERINLGHKNQITKLINQLQTIKTNQRNSIIQQQNVNNKHFQQQIMQLKQINKKLIQERRTVDQIKNQNLKLIEINHNIHSQLKQKNQVIGHLWEVKHVEYQNIVDQISKIKQISRN